MADIYSILEGRQPLEIRGYQTRVELLKNVKNHYFLKSISEF